MSYILLVGSNVMIAHNIARDLIEDRGQEIIVDDRVSATITTEEEDTYVFLPQYDVKAKYLRGKQFDEVYFMADMTAGLVEGMKKELINNTQNAKFFLVEPDAIGFTFR